MGCKRLKLMVNMTGAGTAMAIYYVESGNKDAPTIVFIHGGGISGWMWAKQVEYFKDYHNDAYHVLIFFSALSASSALSAVLSYRAPLDNCPLSIVNCQFNKKDCLFNYETVPFF